MRDTQLPADFTVTVPPSMQLMDYLRIGLNPAFTLSAMMSRSS